MNARPGSAAFDRFTDRMVIGIAVLGVVPAALFAAFLWLLAGGSLS